MKSFEIILLSFFDIKTPLPTSRLPQATPAASEGTLRFLAYPMAPPNMARPPRVKLRWADPGGGGMIDKGRKKDIALCACVTRSVGHRLL